jgi:type 1 glutamine amidotransferase
MGLPDWICGLAIRDTVPKKSTIHRREPATLILALVAAAVVCGRQSVQPGDQSATANPQSTPPKVLYLTHSAGFRHGVLPLTRELLPEFGRADGLFEATVTEDCALVSAESLARFDAVVFYTTGELPMDDAQKRALVDFVQSGRGFVGIHSATDTFYKWPEYGEMIGGYFDGHPWHEAVGVRVEDASHPATRHLPPRLTITDEIYQFKDWSRSRVQVLLSLDPESVDLTKKGVHRTDRDFALAWTRTYGKGRVFYTALGHEPDVWRDDRFRQHLRGGIRWAMGK